ncbi:MAG: nuclear transport factor 2 family protein [Nocardioidaceae bacterium]
MAEPRESEEDVRRAVTRLNTVFYEAIESADLDTMQDLWLQAPDTVCVHPGAAPVRGAGPINRSWALVMAHTPYIQFFLTDVEVGLQDGTASVTCTENVLTGDERTGPDAFGGGSAVATNVFVRTPEGWRLWIHHASPVVSASEHDDD